MDRMDQLNLSFEADRRRDHEAKIQRTLATMVVIERCEMAAGRTLDERTSQEWAAQAVLDDPKVEVLCQSA